MTELMMIIIACVGGLLASGLFMRGDVSFLQAGGIFLLFLTPIVWHALEHLGRSIPRYLGRLNKGEVLVFTSISVGHAALWYTFITANPFVLVPVLLITFVIAVMSYPLIS